MKTHSCPDSNLKGHKDISVTYVSMPTQILSPIVLEMLIFSSSLGMFLLGYSHYAGGIHIDNSK
jgi:hypothetical protein